MKRACLAVLLFLFISAFPAVIRAGGLEVSGFAGGNFAGGDLGAATYQLGGGETNFKLDSNYLFGFRLAYNYTSVFGVEGSFTVSPGSVNAEIIDEISQSTSHLKVLDATTYLFSANAVYNFPLNGYTVFVTAGLGSATLSTGSPVGFAEGPVPEGSTGFAFNLGAGLKYHLGERLYLRGDLRKYFFEEDFGFAGFTGNPGTFELSFGVGMTFSGNRGGY